MARTQTDFKGLDRSIRMQKIVDAASGLFHKKGFKAATLEEVAKELHLTKAALYNYIPSKGKLLSIIYGQAFEKIFHRIYEISASQVSPAEKLRRIIRDLICNIITSDIAMFSVFFAEENQLPSKDFQVIRAEKKRYTKLVMEIIEEGIEAGVFKPVDARLQAYGILGMCNWLYKWYKPHQEMFSPEEIADHFIALLETGYLANHQPEQQTDSPPSASQQDKRESGVENPTTYQELKVLCDRLSSLVDRLGR